MVPSNLVHIVAEPGSGMSDRINKKSLHNRVLQHPSKFWHDGPIRDLNKKNKADMEIGQGDEIVDVNGTAGVSARVSLHAQVFVVLLVVSVAVLMLAIV